MRTKVKFLLGIAVMSLSPAGSAFASIQIDTELALESEHIYGYCRLAITKNEPYSYLNSNCNLDKDDITIIGHNLSGYEIGWPRSTTKIKMWHLLKPGAPIGNSEYCARFGEFWAVGDPLRVTFGHHSNPDLNIVTQGRDTCETAVPQVKAYYQTTCLGSFVWVYSVESLVFGLHLSYRELINPAFCMTVAVFPGGN